jgi:hypothetical protein
MSGLKLETLTADENVKAVREPAAEPYFYKKSARGQGLWELDNPSCV